MENMEPGEAEQTISTTPILDNILATLPPIKLEMQQFIVLNVAKEAQTRLLEKLNNGNLTQKDIENELSGLPDLSGIEDSKKHIVNAIRKNLIPHGDIKKLPLE